MNGLNWTDEQLSAYMNKDGKATAADRQSEREFQREVVKRALLFGWKVYHTYDSRRSAAGFPDLVMVRDKVIFVELKTETGKLSKEQEDWIGALANASMEAHVWRPSMMDQIVRILR